MIGPAARATRAMAAAACLAGWAAGAPASAAAPLLELEVVATGLELPLLATHAGDGSGRLFVAEQAGRVRIHDGERLLEKPFLDIREDVLCCGQGLLGLAFHPDYADNGLFFVSYIAVGGDSVLERFSVSKRRNRAAPASRREILRLNEPSPNHNGGHLAFGPDGYLYWGSGDGGGDGDPQGNAQALDVLLGKILRLDVDAAEPYAIPDDNPFRGEPGAVEEIWAYGLRNPWRFSFDRETGDLFVADVGQDRFEEVNFQRAGSPGGENYGWSRKEGTSCYRPEEGCEDPDDVDLRLANPHSFNDDAVEPGGIGHFTIDPDYRCLG